MNLRWSSIQWCMQFKIHIQNKLNTETHHIIKTKFSNLSNIWGRFISLKAGTTQLASAKGKPFHFQPSPLVMHAKPVPLSLFLPFISPLFLGLSCPPFLISFSFVLFT